MGVRLPEEYQEVEYIEANGTQIIDTDYLPVDGDEMSIELSFTRFPGSKNYYCLAATDNSDPQVQFVFGNDSGSRTLFYKYFSTGPAKMLKTSFAVNTIYRIDVASNGDCTCNGVTVSPVNNLGYATGHMRFFARMAGNVNFHGRLYKFVASHGGIEKVDLMPCYRKADDEAGLYDLVSGTFFTNAGTGEFVVGPDVIDSISPLMVAWRRAMMSQNVEPSGRLPKQYQEVEYIRSAGSQFINISDDYNQYEYSAVAAFMTTRNQYACLCGWSDDAYVSTNIGYSGKMSVSRSNGRNTSKSASVTSADYIGQKLKFDCFKNYARISNPDTGVVLAENTDYFEMIESPVWLFHCDSPDAKDYMRTRYVNAKLYGFKVYLSGGLIHDLVPCYRKSDNKPGLYDIISETFYTNQGNGDFTVGPDIN